MTKFQTLTAIEPQALAKERRIEYFTRYKKSVSRICKLTEIADKDWLSEYDCN